MRAAVFLDRDGVLNIEKHYVSRVEDFEFISGAVEALRTFHRLGFPLVVVTNQSGIARGFSTDEDFQTLTAWMLAVLSEAGAPLTAVYHCPHAPDAGCACRKPAPGMFLQAAREHAIDLAASWMIGDRETDIEAARRAGLSRTVLVRSGHPVEAEKTQALYVCERLSDTVRIISAEQNRGTDDAFLNTRAAANR